mgnify:CR=1 FL=1
MEKIHGGKSNEKEENFNVGMYGSVGSNSCYTSKCGKKNQTKNQIQVLNLYQRSKRRILKKQNIWFLIWKIKILMRNR